MLSSVAFRSIFRVDRIISHMVLSPLLNFFGFKRLSNLQLGWPAVACVAYHSVLAKLAGARTYAAVCAVERNILHNPCP
jgi:hypothetical protein